MRLTVQESQFFCKICKEEVIFSINDESSYLSKSIHESFFGMELSTYRVRHSNGNEYHVNSVIIDHKGLFRGHLDAFVEAITLQTDAPPTLTVQQIGDNVMSKDLFSLFYVVNHQTMQAMVYENINSLDSIKFIETVHAKVKEACEIYVDKHNFTFAIADIEVDVALFNGYLLIYSLQNKKVDHKLEELIAQFIAISLDVLNHDSFILGIRLLSYIVTEVREKNHITSLLGLISNPLIFSIVDVKYPEKLPRIVKRISDDIGISEFMLIELFNGKLTISQLMLESPDSYHRISEMIEYVNRRKLLD